MKSYFMDCFICGDVGFGKIEVVICGVFKVVVGGKQVVVFVFIMIFVLQYYCIFKEWLEEFGVMVDYVNCFWIIKEKNVIFQWLKDGEIDIVIGIYVILNKKIGFKDFGLFIIDEEQKFGVVVKEKFCNIKVNVDIFILIVIFILCILQFFLMAVCDLFIICILLFNWQFIYMEVWVFSEEVVKEVIYYEVNWGGQVFFVYNWVKFLFDIIVMVCCMCLDVEIVSVYGQMDFKELEKILIYFIDGCYDVLVCINIIEIGLDILNVNIMIINNVQ